jgi:bacterioferritin
MASEELKEMLNRAIAREMQVSIQYMWQHIEAKGILGEAASPILRQIAIQEMLHAEQIAERLSYLGGKPTTKPGEVKVGDSLKEMLDLDVAAEEEAIQMYREIIKKAEEEFDVVTRKLFENILIEEEKHHDTFMRMREGM